MTEAQKIQDIVLNDPRGFSRREAIFLAVAIGGVEVWNSNQGQRDISFAPDIKFALGDGSKIVIGYSTAHVE